MRLRTIILLTLTLLFLPTISPAQVPTVGYITNQTLTTASSEYRVALGRGIKAFSVQLRGSYDLRIAFVVGETATNYRTIKTSSSAIYYSPNVAWDGVIYLRCEQAAQVAEIEYWR